MRWWLCRVLHGRPWQMSDDLEHCVDCGRDYWRRRALDFEVDLLDGRRKR